MDLNTFIVTVFCLVDDWLKEQGRLRQRGPAPKLSDSEVLSMEIVGEFLGIDTDKGLHRYFRNHYGEWFPALREVHRTTFWRQAANLWKAKERLWQTLATFFAPHDPSFALCDSLPLPVCLFARAYRCRRFRGEAAFGKDTLLKQTFYGFRVHVRVCWPGLVSRFCVAPANTHELSVLPELVERTSPGTLIGDRNYWSPSVKEELAKRRVELLAPYYRWKTRDPSPERSACLSRLRYRIDTVFSQLAGRYSIKRMWARDLWHLANRLLRKVLSHTVAFVLNHRVGNKPLQLSWLLT
ncbi:MAG TPA: IS982 family transposase [Rubrobacteraceae bacterium]|nr:IS982 family transposase [Rubrobacteraceae bacterium]